MKPLPILRLQKRNLGKRQTKGEGQTRGSNVPEAFWVMEERRGNKGEPYAIRSPFGWTLFEPTNSTNNQPLHHMVNLIQEKEQQENSDTLLQPLQQFWKIEHGIASPDVKASMSVEDKHALSIMNKSVKLVDNHYQIGLPWKQEIPYLPNNRCLAEQRLKSLKKRFLRDEELFDKYKSTVLDYIGKGHARRVPEQEVNVQDKPLWYLPHHPVFNPNKPNTTRVVFDCAARFKETSLNDQLLSGPDLTNTIVGVLTRFRQERVALAADIECMFHQVKVTPDDYDAFRFLWWRDNDLHKDLVDYRMEVHLFGATSSPIASCASYALRRTAEDNKDQYNKDIVSTVDKNFYVDDCLKSVKSTDEAVTLGRSFHVAMEYGDEDAFFQKVFGNEYKKTTNVDNDAQTIGQDKGRKSRPGKADQEKQTRKSRPGKADQEKQTRKSRPGKADQEKQTRKSRPGKADQEKQTRKSRPGKADQEKQTRKSRPGKADQEKQTRKGKAWKKGIHVKE
ncbi:hypothetical protein QZH41_004836 [Actinostola sp. cb2023]|nr:hypothetical protein QZH41_004836 [Actinostola sp. cb2023]